ncbi:hypothetical protein CHS0354_013096, partial [Potamilus streckersoni]
NGTCYNTPGSFNCKCYVGFTGNNCETDVDECKGPTNACSGHGICSNNLGSFICYCRDGYTGHICNTDVDECRHGDSVCNNKGTCNNTPGSFNCKCYVGFTGNNCETDVDECKGPTNACSGHGTCSNNLGSFICHCHDGYTGHICNNVTKCVEMSAPAHSKVLYGIGIEQMIRTYLSTVSMRCDKGYIAAGITILCCNKHGEWDGSLGQCDDVDECRHGDSVCQNKGTCYNTPGSFNCKCYVGFTGNKCEKDVDECKGSTNACSGHGTCSNNLGSFICHCRDGYTGHICNTVTKCVEISAPTHSMLQYGIGIEEMNRTYRSTVSMRCDKGYIAAGNTILRCSKHGEWDGSFGQCAVINCTKQLAQPDHIELSYTEGIEGIRTYNTVVTSRCKEGYNLTEKSQFRCNEHGNWEGSSGTCKVIFCEGLLEPNSSILSIDGGIEGNWTYNTTATIACDQGYTLMGNKMVRCGSSSQWNGSIGYCVALQGAFEQSNVLDRR